MKVKIWRMAKVKPPERRRKFYTRDGKRYRIVYVKQDQHDPCDLCHFENDSSIADEESGRYCPYVHVKDDGEINEQRACIVLDEGTPTETSLFIRATKKGWAEYLARLLG